MKSGQISQVFIYIMSGIIITAVLGFGVKMMFDVTNKSDDIACLRFKENLRRTVQSDMGYGTVDKLDLNVDCDYRQICFVDLTKSAPTSNAVDAIPGDVTKQKYPIIWDSWNNKVKQNVFFVNNVAEDFYYIENLHVARKSVCKDITNAGVRVTLKGKGKYVILSDDSDGNQDQH